MARTKALVGRFPTSARSNQQRTNNKTIQIKRNITTTKNDKYKKEWTISKNNKWKKKIKVFFRQK